MTRLSINLDKVALIRNSRGGTYPSVTDIASRIVKLGCTGITLHPRQDRRHALVEDVVALCNSSCIVKHGVSINVEGDIRDDIIGVVNNNPVHQFTLVPVSSSSEKTTVRGWNRSDDDSLIPAVLSRLSRKMNVILFIDPDIAMVDYAASFGFSGVEIMTQNYSDSYYTSTKNTELERIRKVALHARNLNLRVHLGHGLDLNNIYEVVRDVTPDEVSVGHSLISEALECGLDHIVGMYKKICRK